MHRYLLRIGLAALIATFAIAIDARIVDAAEIDGTDGNDHLVGTAEADQFWANGGDDWVEGRGGNDEMAGMDGRDRLYGGSGSDWMYGNRHNDRLVGGGGSDLLYGGTGDDVIRVAGDGVSDWVKCGRGEDTVYFSAGDLISSDCETAIEVSSSQ